MSTVPAPQKQIIHISTKSMFTALAVIAFAVAVWHTRGMLILILTSIVISIFIEYLVMPLERKRIPRILAVIFVYMVVLGMISSVVLVFIPTFINELAGFKEFIPEDSQIQSLMTFIESSQDLVGGQADAVGKLVGGVTTGIFQFVSQSFGGVANTILVFVLSFYLSIEKRGVERFLRAVTPLYLESQVVNFWQRVEYKVGQWFKGQMLTAMLLAILTYFGLWILDVQYALMISIFSGILGLVPFGIILGGIGAVVLAYVSGGVKVALLTFGLYIVLQQIEGYLLQPLVLKKLTGLPSLVILVSFLLGLSLAGFLGFILAIPGAVVAMELLDVYEAKKLKELEETKIEDKKEKATKKFKTDQV